MDPHAIEAAYVPFATELRAGGFTTPEQGWPAELIAAHIASNNDLVAAVAEAIAAGQDASFDNATAVDDAQLSAVVVRSVGRARLAAAVETSAGRLAAAMRALDATTATSALAVRLVDAGAVVRDEPCRSPR